MSDKKYELTTNYLLTDNYDKIYQIKALRDFGHVKKGQLGGYIAHEGNLSHEGNCWIYDNASVSENARVMHNAILRNYSSAEGNARIYNNSIILDDVTIKDNACCTCSVVVRGNTVLKDNVSIEGDDIVSKTPIYVALDRTNITITEQYVLIDYPSDAKHYTSKEWFDLSAEQLEETCGFTWTERYKSILDNLVYEHIQQ